jgi:hypothetical protein
MGRNVDIPSPLFPLFNFLILRHAIWFYFYVERKRSPYLQKTNLEERL